MVGERFVNNVKLKQSESVTMETISDEDLFTLTLIGNMRRRTGTVTLVAKNVAGEAILEANLSLAGTPPTFMEKPYISHVLNGTPFVGDLQNCRNFRKR